MKIEMDENAGCAVMVIAVCIAWVLVEVLT